MKFHVPKTYLKIPDNDVQKGNFARVEPMTPEWVYWQSKAPEFSHIKIKVISYSLSDQSIYSPLYLEPSRCRENGTLHNITKKGNALPCTFNREVKVPWFRKAWTINLHRVHKAAPYFDDSWKPTKTLTQKCTVLLIFIFKCMTFVF